jgi:hypothetical protein
VELIRHSATTSAWRNIAKCAWLDTRALEALLSEGWEAFAATNGGNGETVLLRRATARENAGVVQPEPRLEREAARLVDEINRDMERASE